MRRRVTSIALVVSALIGGVICARQSLAVVGGGDIKMEVPNEGDVVFSHADHVRDAELKCMDCHVQLYFDVKNHKRVTAKQMEVHKMSCGACHDGDKAFSVKEQSQCTDCHKK